MENVLVVWANAEFKELAKSLVKASLKHNYSIEERDIMKTDNGGFEFLFDDETGGHASFDFIEDGRSLGIKIKANHSWDAIMLYEMVQGCFEDDEAV